MLQTVKKCCVGSVLQVSVMMLVPPLILFLGGSPRVTPKHLQHIRRIYSGAAPLGASDMERVNTKLPSHGDGITSQGKEVAQFLILDK